MSNLVVVTGVSSATFRYPGRSPLLHFGTHVWFLCYVLDASATIFETSGLCYPLESTLQLRGGCPPIFFRQRCREGWGANFCRHKTRRYPRVEGQLWGRYTQHPLTNRTTRTLRPNTSCDYCPLLPVLSSATRLLIHHGVTSMKTFSGIECLRF